MKKIKTLILFGLVLMFSACADEEDIDAVKELLVANEWGYPEIIYSEQELPFFLNAPTVFNIDGTVKIGQQKLEFWQMRGDKSLELINNKIIWEILKIDDKRLHVSMKGATDYKFYMECIYYPVTK